jgi:hypothetical protein
MKNSNSNLHHMIMIPKNLFDKFKPLIDAKNHLTKTDLNLKNTMLNKNLSEYDKWLLYYQTILKRPYKKTEDISPQ